MIDIWTMVHVNFIAYSKSVRKVMSIFFQSNGNINGSQSPPTNSSSNSDCFDNGSEENTFTSLKELSRHLPKGPAEVPNMKHTFHNEYKLNELMKQTGKWFFISLVHYQEIKRIPSMSNLVMNFHEVHTKYISSTL